MTWDFKGDLPIYKQLMNKLRMRIVNGTYPPGERIPAVRELAVEAGVNPNTMQRALAELEREGLLLEQRTAGRFVTDDPGALKVLRREMAEEWIRALFEQLARLGLSQEEIVDAVSAWSERHTEE